MTSRPCSKTRNVLYIHIERERERACTKNQETRYTFNQASLTTRPWRCNQQQFYHEVNHNNSNLKKTSLRWGRSEVALSGPESWPCWWDTQDIGNIKWGCHQEPSGTWWSTAISPSCSNLSIPTCIMLSKKDLWVIKSNETYRVQICINTYIYIYSYSVYNSYTQQHTERNLALHRLLSIKLVCNGLYKSGAPQVDANELIQPQDILHHIMRAITSSPGSGFNPESTGQLRSTGIIVIIIIIIIPPFMKEN